MQRKDLLALAILVLITVAVRLPGVFNRAIWYDEAITLLETAGNAVPTWSALPTPAASQKKLMVGSPSLGEVATGLRETDVHPPVYYGLLSIWRQIAGESIEAARLFSVFWSTASVALLYLLLRAFGFSRPFWPSLIYSLSSGAVHYGHEARNYSLAMFFVILATFLIFLFNNTDFNRRLQFWIFTVSIAACCGLSFQTNYLTIFPIAALLIWCLAWTPKKQRRYVFPAIILSVVFSLIGFGTLLNQLEARPNQFQKTLGLIQELIKIVDSNFLMLWNPVTSNTGIRLAVICTVLVLLLLSIAYLKAAWQAIDKRLFTLMAGLAIAPSFGVLALDLLFSKSLGKSSYVFFGGPAIVVLLTLAIPFFIGLQLTGINFDLERTPEFAGSTLRSLAGRIETSSPSRVVVIGAGHGRGDPASVIYELKPETEVCVVDNHSDIALLTSELASFDEIWIVFAKGRATAAVEQSLFEILTEDGAYRVVFRAKRVAHLQRTR
ncbi:MAG: glycosyltransferase family 39 protein [Acidobacteria bacterium]|nr:glycosyltransferase family 39 protein [Candidatus Sulfomarinibacter kjeldsenii]